MPKFSTRYGYDPRDTGPPKVEDAPEWIRIAYLNGILNTLTFIDRDTRCRNEENRPLGIKDLGESFYVLLRKEVDPDLFDSFVCWETLKYLVKNVEWFHFYDFVELVAVKLREYEEENLNQIWLTDTEMEWLKKFGFKTYQEKTNSLFSDNKIAWRLNSNCNLTREIPSVIEKTLQVTESKLKDKFSPSREHYKKARLFIYDRPSDPQNGVKEIVSALESCGKIIFPGTATLGDVIKAMKKDSKYLPSIISVIEKYYTLANSEPAIRHGGTEHSTLSLADAEFCFHIGVALIRYLMDKHETSI